MANKPMGILNVGSDTYELVDIAGRQATTEVDEKVDGLSASNLPYSESQSTKQKIDEINGKKMADTQIFANTALTSTLTQYDCAWNNGYDLIIVEQVHYGNVLISCTVPFSYFSQTTATRNIQLTSIFLGENRTLQLFVDGNNKIKASLSNGITGMGARIYGIKLANES